jgi:hypothetical protein
MEEFELMRIFITDPKIEALAEKQNLRMQETFGTPSIPLHVIVDAKGKELARFEYKGALTKPNDYLEFLRAGRAKFGK